MIKADIQDTQPRPRYAKPNQPTGDFAAGERTLPASPVVGDFAAGEHELPDTVVVGDFASGEHVLVISPAVEEYINSAPAPEKIVAVRPIPPLSNVEPEISAVPFVPKGDFAQGERTLPSEPVIPDFARGERTLSTPAIVGDFATGEHDLPVSPAVGDFATGEHDLPVPENHA